MLAKVRQYIYDIRIKEGREDNMITDKKKPTSGQVPEGYTRLSANVKDELHIRLKVMSAKGKRSIGSILEEWIDMYSPH